jgi:hypothetical protein
MLDNLKHGGGTVYCFAHTNRLARHARQAPRGQNQGRNFASVGILRLIKNLLNACASMTINSCSARASVRLIRAKRLLRRRCSELLIGDESSHILCSYNLTMGSISFVYPDSEHGQDILLIVSPSRPISSSIVTSLHSGMILRNKVPTPSQHPLIHECPFCNNEERVA